MITIKNPNNGAALKRYQRNPSYDKQSPHCTLLPRYCYCLTDAGMMKCEIGRTGKDNKPVHFAPHVFNGAVTTHKKGRFKANDLTYNELQEIGDNRE